MGKKKGKRIVGLFLAVLAVASVLTVNASAVAVDTPTTQIKFSDSYYADIQLGVGGMSDTKVEVTKRNIVPTAVSSNSSVVSVRFHEKAPYSAYYYDLYEFDVEAWKPGTATITYSTGDGTTLVQKITVKADMTYPGYKLTSDTTQNFSIQTGNSYFMKVRAIMNDGIGDPAPRLTASDGTVLKITWSDSTSVYDHIVRIDAVGKPGQSCDLYLGILGRTSKKLCRVTITPHKGLTLDTNAATLNASEQSLLDTSVAAHFPAYSLGKSDTYRFTAFTSSSVPPAAANNDRVSVKYLRKVSGGYEYQVTALKQGYSLARVTQNGETASFPVYVPSSGAINEQISPTYHSNMQQYQKMVPGESFTYRFTVMGGSEPKFSTQVKGIANTEMIKKDNINYDVNVTAVGQIGTATGLDLSFPNSPVYHDYSSQVSMIELVKVKSDTENNFSVRKYASYIFKLTGSTGFYPDTNTVFQTDLIQTSGLDAYYKITAIGEPGQSSVFYMTADGVSPQEVCTVTVAPPIQVRSDTTMDFSLKQKKSYQFKITAPGAQSLNFYCGTSGVFSTALVKHSGEDFYFKITADGRPGSSAGIYVSVPNQPYQKLCAVSIQ